MSRRYAAMIHRGLISLPVLMFAFVLNAFAADPAVEKYEAKAPKSMSQPEQPSESLEERALKKFERMCEIIELKGEQLKQARALFDSRIEEMQKIMSAARQGELNQSEARGKMAESFKKHREQFESLLSQEQKAKLEKFEKNRSTPESGSGRS